MFFVCFVAIALCFCSVAMDFICSKLNDIGTVIKQYDKRANWLIIRPHRDSSNKPGELLVINQCFAQELLIETDA